MIDTESTKGFSAHGWTTLMSLLIGKDGSEGMAVSFLNPMQKKQKASTPTYIPRGA